MRLKQILRRLMQLPMFTGVAVITLAIGIGANTAIFSVAEGVLLKPLPFAHAEQLVAVDHAAPGVNLKSVGAAPFLYFTYRDEGRSFQDIGLWESDTVSVTGLAQPEEIKSLHVTDGFLAILGVQPALGRSFSRKDDEPGSPQTVILTAGYWRSKFGGDPSAIGRRILLDGRAREIIGVMPDTFRFLDRRPAVILPLRLDRRKTFLGNFSQSAVARLKPGVTIAQANADAARMIPISYQRFPPFPGFSAKVLEEAKLAPHTRSLKEDLVGDVSTVLWVLMGTIGMVLLIACANVANLLLVRADGRQQELAIRAALGAGRGEIARELLLESLMLGIIGGIAGLALAFGALRLLTALAPANLPRLDEISIDGVVLLFTLAISVAAGLLFGSIPVIKYAGPQLSTTLRSGGRTLSASKERHRARSTLVVVQVALALVLLVSSGLMIRTFQALKHVQPGFTRPEEVQTLRISIPESQVKDPVMVIRMEQDIVNKLAAIPGVSSVGLTSIIPMADQGWRDPISTDDREYPEGQIPPLRLFKFASPGLVTTMGNHVVAGRDFTWTDVYENRQVAMVSENMARELWREPSAAIGKRIRETFKSPWREIVGVVSDERDDGVNQKAPSIVSWPILMANFVNEQTFVRRSMAYMIRSSRTGSNGFVNEISQAVWSVNPNLPLANVRTLQEIYNASLARTSFTLVMLAIAGAMALLLGVAGIYGVISYSVSQRTREIGIRIALGAQNAEVTRMFVRHGVMLAAIGIACGLAAAFALMRLMSSLLFDVSPIDPLTYGAVALSLVAAAVIASYVPALRATMIDPVEALRAE
ncbi:MAG: multidrug ABC transporter substrate-binding protein [Acidobacteria bacterium 13_1_40CM_4_65_8]|nr:MAG: multidrug ABC transporter substrate-binding protein [Acidobacteria bacterium 13_1_40CM_4_65_8]